MRLHIVRHADPDYARKTITPAGHLEAEALAARWERVGLNQLFCSPMGRARHTARYTADRLGLTVEVQPWLAELDELRMPQQTPWPGAMAWDTPGHRIREALHQSDDQPPPSWLGSPGFAAELVRVNDDSDRFMAARGFVREGHVYRVTRENRDRVAVFCHGGLGLTWLAHLLAVPVPVMWAGFWLPPSSVTTVLMDEREPGIATPRCLCVGDTSHLYAAGLPIQPAGIKANDD